MNERYTPDTPRNRGDQDAPHFTPVTPAEDFRTILINRVTWGAVIAGVAVSLVTQLLLNMLGLGLGASTLDPGSGDNPEASTFSIAAGIWWTVSGVIAAFIGGHVAGRLSGQPKGSTTGWHGLISWAVATLVVFYLLTSAVGGIIGGAFNQVTRVIGGATEAAATAAGPAVQDDDPFAAIQQEISESIGGSEDVAAMRDAAVAAVRSAVTGNPAEAQQQQERAAQALAQAREIPIEQARTQVQQYTQQYQQVAQQAQEAADTAATAVSTGALVAFVALLLGAIAAWFGGRMGAVDPTVTAPHVDRRLAPRS
jgi:hypothetical protein